MPFTTELVGAYGGAQFTGSDYTNPAVTQPLMNLFADLLAIANSESPPPTPAQLAALQEQLTKVLNIAKNGISVQNTDGGGKSVTYYMTAQMTDSLNEVLKSLQSGGASDLPNISMAQLQAWQTSVQSGTAAAPGLSFNKSLFNILYYVANNFSSSKVSLDPTKQATELVAALTKTGGDVKLSPYAERSLQAMTEVDYVNEGNKLINDTLTKMYEALGITKNVLDSLATLQDLHNQLKVVSRQDNITYTRDDITGNQFQEKYENKMSSFTNNLIPQLSEEYSPWLFPGAEIHIDMSSISSAADPNAVSINIWVTLPNQPLTQSDLPYVFINPITQEIQQFAADPPIKIGGRMFIPLTRQEISDTPEFKAKLAKLLAYQKPSEFTPLSGLFDQNMVNGNIWPLVTTIADTIDLQSKLTASKAGFSAQVAALSAAAGTNILDSTYKSIIDNPQSLYNLSKKVLTDIGSLSTYADVRSWVMDNYQAFNTTDATKAGAYQQGITAAVTAAQSTNDEQKETVRNNLFLFEEFYKSASTVLTQLNQIMVKMGQNIAR